MYQGNTVEKEHFLYAAAQKYVWWQSPEEALRRPQRVLAQLMNIGVWKDLCALARIFSDDELREVLASAENPGRSGTIV
jgi:hypothetical protein